MYFILFQNPRDAGNMCLELALEGERLCKAGDCRSGVAFFQAAVQAGTNDLRTLSAIYSQLGNAYFYLADYPKALHFHKLDLALARYTLVYYHACLESLTIIKLNLIHYCWIFIASFCQNNKSSIIISYFSCFNIYLILKL